MHVQFLSASGWTCAAVDSLKSSFIENSKSDLFLTLHFDRVRKLVWKEDTAVHAKVEIIVVRKRAVMF